MLLYQAFLAVHQKLLNLKIFYFMHVDFYLDDPLRVCSRSFSPSGPCHHLQKEFFQNVFSNFVLLSIGVHEMRQDVLLWFLSKTLI